MEERIVSDWSPPPATTPEAREQQLVVLATDLAEQQLREGVASAAVVTHFLKLAGTRNELELEKLRRENEVLRAKAESLESSKRTDEMYEQAIAAMKSYSGILEESYDEYDEY